MNYEKFEKELYDTANEIVGNVGADVSCTFLDIASFVIDRELPIDEREIKDLWVKWIKAYCFFKKIHNPEDAIISEDKELIVNWASKPEVDTTPFPDNSVSARITAYLLIRRIDCEPI